MIELFRASVRRVACRDYTRAQIEAWAPDDIDKHAAATRHSSKPTWVAEIGGQIVGFTDLETDGHLDCVYVHPDHQRRGIATALVHYIEQRALEQGSSRIYAEVSITAKPFFERSGFRVIAAQTVIVRGQEFMNFRVEKRLSPS